MGNKESREDKKRLLDDDDDEEFYPVFEKLTLVLIGMCGSGKNDVGNRILGEKFLTPWKVFNHAHVEATRIVSGREIHLSRTKGWRGELKSKKSVSPIIHCVKSAYPTGPHAVILVLKVNSRPSESTIRTLESYLSVQLWDHTIVVFTQVEKLGQYKIEDYITIERLQSLIDKCGGRYLEMRNNDTSQITERIEELIASKTSTTFCKISNQKDVKVDDEALLSDWKTIVQNLKKKINYLLNCKKKLGEKLKHNAKNDKIHAEIKAKDAEIERLNNIIMEKERAIERLLSNNRDRPEERRITELEDQLKMKNKEIEKKDLENRLLKAENEQLKTKLQRCQGEATKWTTPVDQCEALRVYCGSESSQDASASSRTHNHVIVKFSARDSALQGWSSALLDILTELTDPELKKMKYYMCENGESRIPQGLMDNKDRVDLAELMLKQWGERRSVIKTRDLVKRIPRNDDNMKDLFTPFLEDLGETW